MELDAKVEATWLWIHLSESINKSDHRPVLVFGGGVRFGLNTLKIEVLGLYHILFIENGRTNYLSVGFGFGF